MSLADYMLATRQTVAYNEPAHDLAVNENSTAQMTENMLRLLYCATKLTGEAGEVAEEIGKMMRDDGGRLTHERYTRVKKELGDVFWYLARICDELTINPDHVLEDNIEKLLDRKERGVLHGSGSDR